jgi:hypothetical protein
MTLVRYLSGRGSPIAVRGWDQEVRMKISARSVLIVSLAVLAGVSALWAHANYTGYSGAPGTGGRCASSCHGSSGGTVAVSGFPTTYTPGQVYQIVVRHSGGSRIENFNSSVRIGTGSQDAGILAAGYNTATYSASGEPNGIHLSATTKDSAKFSWNAPGIGTGLVKLYLAAHQGSIDGANTDIILSAGEASAIEEMPGSDVSRPCLSIENRIVSRYVVLRAAVPIGMPGRLRIVGPTGRVQATIAVPREGVSEAIIWTPKDRNGRRLAPGPYFAVLSAGGQRLIDRFMVVE